MGTRSLTIVSDKAGAQFVVMYRQFDGYPSVHGKELGQFLAGGVLVNGLTNGDPPKVFNGPGCLAASLVAHFKREPGGFYLQPAGETYKPGDCGSEFVYRVKCGEPGQTIMVTVENAYGDEGKPDTFHGPADEFARWAAAERVT